jgi:hypothetical protein
VPSASALWGGLEGKGKSYQVSMVEREMTF